MRAEFKNLTQSLFVSKILDRTVVEQIRNVISSFESARWAQRKNLSNARAYPGSTCRYDFCGHLQMSKNDRDFFKRIAPEFEGNKLAEIAINRYSPGDYIDKHKDRHLYRKNLVIALQQTGDGLLIEDEHFIEDEEGQGILFDGIGPAHSVPPVKKLRYSLIYLYE